VNETETNESGPLEGVRMIEFGQLLGCHEKRGYVLRLGIVSQFAKDADALFVVLLLAQLHGQRITKERIVRFVSQHG
jgi:hypothetical protein